MELSQLVKQGAEIGSNLLLKVAKDGLTAIVVCRDKSPLALAGLDVAALLPEVQDKGVVFGILGTPEVQGPGLCVARGKAPEHGENAKIKYYIKPAVVRSPKFRTPRKQTVDFRELGIIVNVPENKLLLEKVPLTEGIPGTNVMGQPINAKPGKDIKIKVGPGVLLSEDGMRATSEIEGKYMLADGKASVVAEHTLASDVDLSTGNIAFVGKCLTVNGSVLPGFKVKGKGDVFIAKGVQDPAQITAGGDLVIKGGGVGDGVVIKCWGNASIDFIENVGRIEVKGDLTITDAIVQGHARIGGNLRVTSGKGTLIGGEFILGGSTYVKELGSDAEVITNISVGINPNLAEKVEELAREKEIWPDKMSEILKTTTVLKKIQRDASGNLIPEKVALLKEYNNMLPGVMDKVNSITEREQELDAEIEQSANEAVYVYGTVYPGVTVTIAGISRVLSTPETGTVIHFDKEKRQIHCRAMTPEERQANQG
ncbi:MAG: DUF342 domain-containing protein [Deltaproteobacteria bacterium]|nr:DUF342 domain-containing protein [Deltaproteobacteria bacterium]